MISEVGKGVCQKTGKFPCSKGVGANSMRCTKCKLWIHSRCTGTLGKINKENAKTFICTTCLVPKPQLEQTEKIVIGDYAYDVVQQFCYLGDMLNAGGGAKASSVCSTRWAYKKFGDLLPILTSHSFP